MHILSVNDNELNFKVLEQTIYKIVCEVACEVMKDILERIDLMLLARRDTKKYRNKGFRQTCIHTVMGEVKYKRRIYETKDENGKNMYIYLLDQYLKKETIGHVSSSLAEKMVENVLEKSYRKSAESIESLCQSSLSHTAVWNVIQELGKRLEEQDKKLVKQYEKGNLSGNREVDVLFQEADGVWLNMQGKDRPKSGKSRKKEMKIAKTYEGWEKRGGQKDAYLTYNRTIVAGLDKASDFKKLCDATIAKKYNVDEIQYKIINGDGDPWIKAGLGEEGVHYQLDPFHRARAIVRAVPEKTKVAELNAMFDEGRVDEALEYLTELMIEYKDDEKVREKLYRLYDYLATNYEGLKPYKLRDISLPEPPEGLVYRNMGTMESSVCDVIKLRMKGRKMSWTKSGANALGKLLALRASGELYETLDNLFVNVVSEEKLEEIVEEVVQLSAAQVNIKPRKTGYYPIKTAPMPFEGQAMTEGRRAIRNLVENRMASELVLR
jgi:hypothetical protein